MAKLLFGQSCYLRFDAKLWQAMQPYPPLGTLYAASFMRERGHEGRSLMRCSPMALPNGRRRWDGFDPVSPCCTRTTSITSAK